MNRRVAWVAIAVAFGFVVLLGALPWWFSRLLGLQPQKDFVAGLYGGLIGAFFTFILALVAWFQLGGISQTVRLDSQRAHDDSYRASADLLLRLKRDFFQEETRTLITIIANEWIEFVEEYADGKQAEIPFFAVNRSAINATRLPWGIKRCLLKKQAYTAFEVDDILLGHLQDLATLWDRGTLNLEMIDEMFFWYIDLVCEDCEIRKYIRNQQRDESPVIYSGLERLHVALRNSHR